MKTRFIVNLRSGRATRAVSAVRAFAAARGAEVMFTEHAQHGRELAQSALEAGGELVVAVGGDGTMNEVASALVGTPATLGVVPCGSGDGLGRHLGIHGSIAHALDVIEHGTPRLIDSATADGHPFFTVAGIGFEAEIARRFNQLRHRGFLRYLTTSIAAWRHYQPQRYTIGHVAGRDVVTAFTLAVANANQYGNDAHIAPAAKLNDGVLDLTVIPPVTLANATPLACRLLYGDVRRSRGVVSRVAGQFTVERDAPGPLHTDGEVHEAGTRVIFAIRPASLRILAPPIRKS